MNQLIIMPISHRDGSRPSDAAIDYVDGQSAVFSLNLADGQWEACPRQHHAADVGTGRNKPNALLCYQPIEGGAEWFVLDFSGQFTINDQPAFGIQRIAPGDLLCRGSESWFITERISPQPIDAPPSVRQKPCPTCGEKLGAAPVATCSCGRFLHLERPEAPDDPSALNCFLITKVCGGCGQPTTLEPQLVPEPPPPLQPYTDELDDDSLEL